MFYFIKRKKEKSHIYFKEGIYLNIIWYKVLCNPANKKNLCLHISSKTKCVVNFVNIFVVCHALPKYFFLFFHLCLLKTTTVAQWPKAISSKVSIKIKLLALALNAANKTSHVQASLSSNPNIDFICSWLTSWVWRMCPAWRTFSVDWKEMLIVEL